MTLRELIDISEVPLVISEEDHTYQFMILHELNIYSSDDFKDLLTKDMLDRKIRVMKAKDSVIYVCLEEVAR